MTESPEKKVFWAKFLDAVGAEYTEERHIVGASGVSHRVSGVGVDEKGKRLIIVSEENDAKSAAFCQLDMQLSIKDLRVCVVRPVAVSLPQLISSVTDLFGTSRLYQQHFKLFEKPKAKARVEKLAKQLFEKNTGSIARKFDSVPMSIIGQVQFIMQQIISKEMAEAIKNLAKKKDM